MPGCTMPWPLPWHPLCFAHAAPEPTSLMASPTLDTGFSTVPAKPRPMPRTKPTVVVGVPGCGRGGTDEVPGGWGSVGVDDGEWMVN